MYNRFAKKITVIDAFPKTEQEHTVRSEKGGLLTVIVATLLILLTLSEFREYWHLQQTHEFIVDRQVDQKIQLNVDLTVAMNCKFLTVDVFDASGGRMHLATTLETLPAQFSVGKAQKLGVHKRENMNLHEMIEIARQKSFDKNDVGDASGCRIFGSIKLNKVASNVHITALGHGYSGTHVDHEAINFTHRIDEFSFGQFYPKLVNPLDDSVEIAETNLEFFQYFISVVPTIYVDNRDHVLLTNQYAVTDYNKKVDHTGNNVPGLFFKYDIEPISVRVTEKRKPFFHFLVRLSGIIGGVFVTAGFAYRILNFAADYVQSGGRLKSVDLMGGGGLPSDMKHF